MESPRGQIGEGDNNSHAPKEIARIICKVGYLKTRLKPSNMFVLAVLAGVYIGFGAQLATTVTMDTIPRIGLGLTNLVAGTVFSVGLMLVVVGGAELFTGNALILLSYLSGEVKFSDTIRSWLIVYGGNFVGSVLLAMIVLTGELYTMGGYAEGLRALAIANGKLNLGFSQLVARGIACNWLVCLAVWLATSSRDTTGKILSCLFPIAAFVASGFEHSIANMFFVPIGILLKGVPDLAAVAAQSGLDLTKLTWMGFLTKNLLPVTIGNIIGGGFFVATLYWYTYMRPSVNHR